MALKPKNASTEELVVWSGPIDEERLSLLVVYLCGVLEG